MARTVRDCVCCRGIRCRAGLDHTTVQTADGARRATVLHLAALVSTGDDSKFGVMFIPGGLALAGFETLVEESFSCCRSDSAARVGLVRETESFRVDV